MGTKVGSKKVKPISPKKSKKQKDDGGFKRLRSLDCFDELDAKIKAGISPDEVARWLQEDMLQMIDIQRESLRRQLYRYKSELPASELIKGREEPLFIRKAIEKMNRGINELDELEKLYLYQLKRISKNAETEDKLSIMLKGTSKEIQLATDMLEKMIELKMELGLVNRQPHKTQVEGLIGHMPLPNMPEQLENDQDADKTMTRMGLLANKLFKAVEKMEVEEPEDDSIIDVECEETE